ncbi:hypothetical protein B566_EDAN006335 [Ephemera danica]|nr:hypothetical protein B566_EDAN006335 [Ephemera danica]
MRSETAAYPWEKVSIDVADINGIHYLVTVDRFSRYPGVTLLPNLTSASIIKACKDNFAARHGIHIELISDNATPLVGHELKFFLEEWSITQLSMGRNLRSTVPIPPQKLVPAVPPTAEIRAKDQIKRAPQKARHI